MRLAVAVSGGSAFASQESLESRLEGRPDALMVAGPRGALVEEASCLRGGGLAPGSRTAWLPVRDEDEPGHHLGRDYVKGIDRN